MHGGGWRGYSDIGHIADAKYLGVNVLHAKTNMVETHLCHIWVDKIKYITKSKLLADIIQAISWQKLALGFVKI